MAAKPKMEIISQGKPIDPGGLAIPLPTRDQLNLMGDMAKSLIASGLLPESIQKPSAALAIMLKGNELGLAPMQSFEALDVIRGKISYKGWFILASIRKSGKGRITTKERTDKRAVVVAERFGEEPRDYAFSMEEATALGLAGKDNWKKQRATMLFWRAVAKAGRAEFADVIGGMYTREELGDARTIEHEDAPEEIIEDAEATVSPDGGSEWWIVAEKGWGSENMIQPDQAKELQDLAAKAKVPAADLRDWLAHGDSKGRVYPLVSAVSRKQFGELHAMLTDVAEGKAMIKRINPETQEMDPKGLVTYEVLETNQF